MTCDREFVINTSPRFFDNMVVAVKRRRTHFPNFLNVDQDLTDQVADHISNKYFDDRAMRMIIMT